MAEIIDEISEDLQKQKLNKFWAENKYWVIGGIFGSIILTGSISFWKNWEYQRDTKATAQLTSLVENISKNTSSLASFAESSNKKHSTVARFILANAYNEKGQKEKSLKVYKQISNTKGIDKTYRDLANLLSISLRINTGKFNDLQSELDYLTTEENTWRYTAMELKALLFAKNSNFKEAINNLDKIIDNPVAPRDLRKRAVKLKELYNAEENKF